MGVAMKRGLVYLGDEFMDGFNCKFWLDPATTGSYFRFPVRSDPHAKCVIGGNQDHWWEVVGSLIHECHEFSLSANSYRFRSTSSLAESSSSTLFCCNHDQLLETHLVVGGAVASILPALSKAWQKAHRKG